MKSPEKLDKREALFRANESAGNNKEQNELDANKDIENYSTHVSSLSSQADLEKEIQSAAYETEANKYREELLSQSNNSST